MAGLCCYFFAVGYLQPPCHYKGQGSKEKSGKSYEKIQ